MLKRLSTREREIANLVAAGLSNRLVAERLHLQTRTVETHLASAFNKLGISSRVALTAIVLRSETDVAPASIGYLPIASTSFVGRDAELERTRVSLASARMLTLLGPGGIGKSRFSLELARRIRADFVAGAWFVSLAALAPDADVAPVVIATLGCDLPFGSPTPAALAAFVGRKPMLLVLDNCEHVVRSAAEVTATLLRTCPNVRIVATSRERLRVDGESTFALPLLELPRPNDPAPVSLDEARRFAALALFIDRAGASGEPLAWGANAGSSITNICRRLDGIPLAIELAAARAAMLGCEAIEAQLDARLDVLGGGNRGTSPHQTTLRTSIAWSYDLLGDAERELFRTAGIFVGGFTAEAIAEVRADASQSAAATLPHLISLVEKSLVVVDRKGSSPRFGLLESTRAFALERLAESEELTDLGRRHAAYFAAYVDTIDRAEVVADSPLVAEPSLPDLDNVRAALARSLASVDPSDAIVAARLAVGGRALWRCVNAYAEGATAVRRARLRLEGLGTHVDAEISARLDESECLHLVALAESGAALECGSRALPHRRDSDEPERLTMMLLVCGAAAMYGGRLEQASSLIDEGERRARALALRRWIAFATFTRGTLEFKLGRTSEAREALAEAETLFDAISHPARASATAHLCDVLFSDGDVDAAIETAERGLAATLGKNLNFGMVAVLCNLAGYRIAAGRLDEARDALREVVEAVRKFESDAMRLTAFDCVAALMAAEGRAEVAVRIAAYVERVREEKKFLRPTVDEHVARHVERIRADLAPSERVRLTRHGALLTESEVFAMAMASVDSRSLSTAGIPARAR